MASSALSMRLVIPKTDWLPRIVMKAHFRQVFWLNLILIVLALFLDFSSAIKMVLVVASFISLITELFNTAVEAAVDHTSTEKHELAKRAKDAGSAAQLMALFMLFMFGLLH